MDNFSSELYKTTPVVYTIMSHLTYDSEPLKLRVKRILTNSLQKLYDDLSFSKLDRVKQMLKMSQSVILKTITELKNS